MIASLMVPGLALAIVAGGAQALAEDIGKKNCMPDARRLCAAQVHAFDRKGAEACLFRRIEETSPHCHDTILLIHAQRLAKAQKPAP